MEQSAVVAGFGGAQPSHPCGLSQRSQMPHGLLRRWGICRVPSFGLRERVNDLTISSCTARERAWSFVKPGAELKETLSFFFFPCLEVFLVFMCVTVLTGWWRRALKNYRRVNSAGGNTDKITSLTSSHDL